jgi:nitrile hydratase
MNGIHDMGGMQDMGAVQPERNEPVFHEHWEGRAFALFLASGNLLPSGLSVRFAIEQIPPADYLRMSYFERWVVALENLMLKAGILTRAEIESGKPATDSPKAKPALIAAMVQQMLSQTPASSQNLNVRPRFEVNQRVRARNMNPTGHTRLPRYVRGRVGTIVQDQGVFGLEDTNATTLDGKEQLQHVYTVRFAARELWGEQASPKDAVYIDM